MTNLRGNQGGYVILLSVLVVGAVGTAVATSLLLLGIGAGRSSLDQQRSVQARALANSCAEEALERLRRDNTYAGGVTLSLGAGSCQIGTVGGSGDTNRTVEVTGTVDQVVRKVYLDISSIGPPTDLTSWQEVDAF